MTVVPGTLVWTSALLPAQGLKQLLFWRRLLYSYDFTWCELLVQLTWFL